MHHLEGISKESATSVAIFDIVALVSSVASVFIVASIILPNCEDLCF